MAGGVLQFTEVVVVIYQMGNLQGSWLSCHKSQNNSLILIWSGNKFLIVLTSSPINYELNNCFKSTQILVWEEVHQIEILS